MLPGKCRRRPCPLPPSGTAAARPARTRRAGDAGVPSGWSTARAQVCAPAGPAHPAAAGVALRPPPWRDGPCGDTRSESQPRRAAGGVGPACGVLGRGRRDPCRNASPARPGPSCGSGGGRGTPSPPASIRSVVHAGLSPRCRLWLDKPEGGYWAGAARGTPREERRDSFVPTPECAIGIKLLSGMTQPPPAPRIDLGWGVFADFTTSLVEAGEPEEKWQLLGRMNSFFHRLVDVLCLLFMVS